MGWPVVLKGLGARLTHKTERGLVRLNIDGPKQLREAADDVSAAAGDDSRFMTAAGPAMAAPVRVATARMPSASK